ncbi:general secretion pathway protein M [gamma proteobacterium HTCC5015]|nr:general secretion pathway protein M [gamma proteobacterium HTCC5015]
MEWWHRYSQREQRTLLAGGAVLAVFLIYMLLLEPLVDFHQQGKADLETHRELHQWMAQAVAEYRSIGGSQSAPVASSGSVAVAVENALKQSGLPKATRIAPKGQKAVSVSYDSVAFDRLMHTLDKLTLDQGLQLAQFQASAVGDERKGMASVEFELERAQ